MKFPSNIRSVILLDIDHTIRNSFWRDPMIGSSPWEEYHQAGAKDKPYPDMIGLIQTLASRGWNVYGLTAIEESQRQDLMKYLILHDVPLDDIIMRPTKDFTKSPELKVKQAKDYFCRDPSISPEKKLSDIVAFVLDDRDDVVAAFRAEGVAVLQVHQRRD